MASITKTASLAWGYDTYWNKTGVAAQGAWNATGTRTGAIYLDFGTTLKNTIISNISFTASFGGSGWGTHTSKALSFYSSNYQTIDTSIQPQAYRKSALGTVSTPAFNNTETITLNSSTNATLFAAIKAYFEAGNTLLCIYNGENSNISSTYTFTQNYLTMTSLNMTVTYSPTYTLTLNKGTGISSVTGAGRYASGTTVSAGATASTGYDFTKWTTGSSASSTQASTANPYSFTLNSNVTLYAQATIKTYAVTYNANGGSGAPSNQTKTYGTNLTLSSKTPTRTGYAFGGWNTNASGTGTNYAAGATYKSNAALTLYAKWTPYVLTVTYNANGGTQASGNSYTLPYSTTAKYGENYNGTNGLWDISTFGLTKSGSSASLWNTAANGSGVDLDQTTAYTAVALATACGKNLSTGNVTINVYPKWSANSYTVTYNANGGEGSMAASSVSYGASFKTRQNAFTKFGYTFNGWNEKADGTGTAWGITSSHNGTYESGNAWTWTYTKNITLYAQWKPWTYTIKYFPNGGSGSATTSSHTYDTASVLKANAFTRSGYNFLGWSTSTTGAVVYQDGAAAPQNIDSDGETLNLYAVWSQNSPWTLSSVYIKVDGAWKLF